MSEDEMIKLCDKKINIMRTLEELIKPEEMEMVYELVNVQKKLDSIDKYEIEVI